MPEDGPTDGSQGPPRQVVCVELRRKQDHIEEPVLDALNQGRVAQLSALPQQSIVKRIVQIDRLPRPQQTEGIETRKGIEEPRALEPQAREIRISWERAVRLSIRWLETNE